MGGFTAGPQLRYYRLTRRRRTGDAGDIQRSVIEQQKIRAAFADRQMFRQVPIRTKRPDTQFDDRTIVVIFAGVDERYEHIRAGVIRRRAKSLLFGATPAR